MKVTILKTTPKAKLVQSQDGRTAWMQSRWVRDDGTVNPETFEKNAAALAAEQSVIAEHKAFKDAMHPIGVIDRESDKALAISVAIHEEVSGQTIRRLVWFPKSQVNEGLVPGWLVAAKAKDLYESVRMTSGGYYTMTIAGHEFGF